MRIRIVGQAGEEKFNFGSNGPWLKFKDNLITNNDVVVNQKFGQTIDALICHGYSKKALNEAKKSKVPKNRMVLVLWEPPITHPKLHSDKFLANFGHIYAPSKEWAKSYSTKYFKWPVGKIKTNMLKNFNTRYKKVVIIQSNKVALLRGENYSLRRDVLFESLRLKIPITLHGSGWGKLPIREIGKALLNLLLNINKGISIYGLKYTNSKYRYYCGISNNKYKTLKKYRFSIVIENHSSYISEKIFDSLNSGCITLYIGPKLEDYGLDKNTAIQLDPSSASILNLIENLLKLNDKEILKLHKIQKRHMEKGFKNWNNEIVLKKLATDIKSVIRK